MTLLDVNGVSIRFGGVVALDDVSFTIDTGQICGLIGPNGAGKTTLFNCLSRVYHPTSGSVSLDGRDLSDAKPWTVTRAGMVRTFQNLALFGSMTVLENVMVGAHTTSKVGWLRSGLRWGVAAEERRLVEEAMHLLDRLDLAELAQQPCGGLPFGTLKRIEIARALAASPRLLMLDEPASGLTHHEVAELGDTLRRVRDDFDLTMLLVEHHMPLVMGLSDNVVVLDFGRKIAEGTPDAVRSDPRVIEAYLGTGVA